MIYELKKIELVNTGADDYFDSTTIAVERSLADIPKHLPVNAKMADTVKDIDASKPYYRLSESVEWNIQSKKTLAFYQ